jgi:uncharacterized protein
MYRIFKMLLLLLGVGMVGLSALLYILQGRLLFHPQALPEQNQTSLMKLDGAEVLTLPFTEGNKTQERRGWLVWPAATAKPETATTTLILYFGGNGDELSWMALEPKLPRNAAWAFINYRGYGASDGSPSEATLFEDALNEYDYFTKTRGFKPEKVLLIGRSLGTGVATHLASQRAVANVLLITPYDSIAAVGARHFPWLPVKLFLQHRFDSLALAPKLNKPVTMLVATHDRTIPRPHSQALYDAWAGPKQWYLLEAEHNNILDLPETWQIIERFISAASN